MNPYCSIKLNQFFSYLAFLKLDANQEKWSGNFMASKTFSSLAGINRVYIPKDLTEQDVEELKVFFGDLPFTFWLDQNNKLGNKKLEEWGLELYKTFPLMACALNQLPHYEADSSIKVECIIEKNEILTCWIDLVSAAYNNIPIIEFKKYISYLLSTQNCHAVKFYIGYYNNIPCATNMLIIRDGVVDLHWVGVLPEYRKKGLGYAVTYMPLHETKHLVEEAILYASEMGKPLYEKMGFKEIGSSNVYKLS